MQKCSIWMLCVCTLAKLVFGQNETIPDPPDALCMVFSDDESPQVLDYKDNRNIWEDGYDFFLEFSSNQSTWVLYRTSSDEDEIVDLCADDGLPTDYTLSENSPGDPSACTNWTNNKVDEIIANNLSECRGFDTELTYLDSFLVVYAFIGTLGCIWYFIWRRCKRCSDPDRYQAYSLKTYADILQYQGIDPNRPRCKDDSRTLAEAFLKYDILEGKVVWSNNWCIDFELFLQEEHPVISLFYPHAQHPYNCTERWCSFLGVQAVSIGVAAFITFILAVWNIQPDEADFAVGFVLDLGLGQFITFATDLFASVSTCKFAERCSNKQTRKRCKAWGTCFLVMLWLCSVGFGAMFVAITILFLDEGNIDNRQGIYITAVFSYCSGLGVAYFLVDVLGTASDFHHEWYLQKGKLPPTPKSCFDMTKRSLCFPCFLCRLCSSQDARDDCKSCCFFYCDCSASCCCLALCCFCFRPRAVYFGRKWNAYASGHPDYFLERGSRAMLGTGDGKPFGVTWYDYVRWQNKTQGVPLEVGQGSNLAGDSIRTPLGSAAKLVQFTISMPNSDSKNVVLTDRNADDWKEILETVGADEETVDEMLKAIEAKKGMA